MQHWFTYPNIDPVALRLGPLSVHWYGLGYIFGFICVYLWMSRPTGRRRLGLTPEQIQDFMVYALVGVLVGGRTVFVIADIMTRNNAADYFTHPINLIAVWNGGMAFHGGLLGVIVAMVLFIRKHRGLTFELLGDEIVALIPIAIASVRVVNFINDELPGKICDPDQPFCIKFPAFEGYRYPSQLMEGLLDLAVLPIILAVYRRRPPDGVVAWPWIMLYGITRTIGEFWRQPDMITPVLGLTPAQLLSIGMAIIGAVFASRAARVNPYTRERPAEERVA